MKTETTKTTKTTETTKRTLPEKLKVFTVKNEHGRFLKAVYEETWYDVKLKTDLRPNFTPFYIDTTDGIQIEETEFNPVITVIDSSAIYAPFYCTTTNEVAYI